MWQCMECERSFATKAGRSQHMRAHRRQNGELFSCQLCFQGFPSVTELAYHYCHASGKHVKRVSREDRRRIDQMMTRGVPAIIVDLTREVSPPPVQLVERPFEEYLLDAVFA